MAAPVLKAQHLGIQFGGLKAVDDFNMEIGESELVGLIGPNGAGKTTAFNVVTGVYAPTNGNVKMRGKIIAQGHPTGKMKKLYAGSHIGEYGRLISNTPDKITEMGVARTFQNIRLFKAMTVLDNVLLAPTKVQKRPKAEVQQEAEALLDRVGLLAKKNSYPRELSGGQKQRVAIVRALCMHPEILLFDEVTAALDPEMVREVLDVMLDLAKQGKTMIIVTHEMQFARAIANRVIFLDGGKIVEEAAPAEFFDRPKTERAQRFLRTFTFDAVK